MKKQQIHTKKPETPFSAFIDATYMNRLLDFLKNIDSWKKVFSIATTCAVLLITYYLFKEIERIDRFRNMNPWEYFKETGVSDIDGLNDVIESGRQDIKANVVAVFLYQPQGQYFYRKLEAISPRTQYLDYCNSEMRTPLYNISRTLNELKDAGISIVTVTSDHYDVKLLLAMSFNVAYIVPINVNGVDIGHILFAFKEKPSEIPLNQMRSIVERSKLKIF